jgi:nitrate reductase NapD
LNISSVIVHARPGAAEAVLARLATVAGVEIHAVSDEGKIIVSIESDGDGSMVRAFETVSTLDDVMSASMVYHQYESDPEMDISVPAHDLRAVPQLQGDLK